MRLICPYCGERDSDEFVTRGGVVGPRPDSGTPDALERFHDYVHLRPNPAGTSVEYWYHAAGCRSWLRVRRNTVTHAVLSVDLAAS
jgi:methylglutamate dehydrogenase subunit B